MTYPVLAIAVMLLSALTALVAGRRRGGRWWAATALTAVVLIALTIVFDSLMIYADLFRYDEAHLIGVYVLLAPVEDLAWPVVAALLLPAVWSLLGPRRRTARPSNAAQQEEES
ncbi:lycopene cyclase domain-containing protein [Pseudactinotalea sp. Z1732]|uniref:lycopene cyclase domain-containing protein n=1 Tax=Micrococcales TaxID=85006 RepID=UPI003C7EA8A5